MNHDLEHDPDRDPKNDAAWDLLLKARKTEVGSFFARNVLREVRLMDDRTSSGWRTMLSLPRLVAGAAAAAIVVGLIAVALQDSSTTTQTSSSIAVVEETPATQPGPATVPAAEDTENFDMGDYEDEIEMIDYLDGLLAVQDVSALDDEALSELLF